MFAHEMPEFIPIAVGIGDKYKVTIRKDAGPFTPLYAKQRNGTDVSAQRADRWFLATLYALYGAQDFPRGNLDAGRINRLLNRELVPANPSAFDDASPDARLRIAIDSALAYLAQLQ